MYKFYLKQLSDNRIAGPYTANQLLEKDLPKSVLFSEETINGGKWEELSGINLTKLAEEESVDAEIQSEEDYENLESIANEDEAVANPEVINNDQGEELTFFKKWNWGAFVLPVIWGIGNGIFWPLLVGGVIGILAPLLELLLEIPGIGQGLFYCVTIILRIYLGAKGNRESWLYQKEPRDITKFIKKQKIWNVIGGVAAIVAVIYLVVYIFS